MLSESGNLLVGAFRGTFRGTFRVQSAVEANLVHGVRRLINGTTVSPDQDIAQLAFQVKFSNRPVCESFETSQCTEVNSPYGQCSILMFHS